MLSQLLGSTICIAFIAWIACSNTLEAGTIRFDADQPALILSDFPPDAPATLQDLYAADQANGWQLVQRLDDGSGYRINVSIWVGDDSGNPASLAIGTSSSSEQLELQGNLWVRPHEESGRNRLVVGDPSNPSARSRIAFDCEFPEEFGLLAGRRTGGSIKSGGELLLYHADILPLREALRGGFSQVGETSGLYAERAEFIGCSFEGIHSRAMYGLSNRNAVIRDCTFSNCERVFSGGEQLLEACRFIANTLALDRSSGTFIDCSFEDNATDIIWTDRRIVWIDTGVKGPFLPPEPPEATEADIPSDSDPGVIDYRLANLILRDPQGNPHAGATLVIRSTPESPFASEGPVVVITQEDGTLPTDLHQNSLLLARTLYFSVESDHWKAVPVDHTLEFTTKDGSVHEVELNREKLLAPGPIEIEF